MVLTAIATSEPGAAEAGPASGKTAELGAPPDRRGWDMAPFIKRQEPVLRPTPGSKFQCPIRGKEVLWEEQNVYNPAAVVRDGKVYLLYRADDKSPDLKWGRTCRIGLAWSEDGVNFTRHPKPVLYPDNDPWKKYEWEGGCEDLHIIEGEDGTYYMNYTTWNGSGDTLSVATSRDLLHWTKHGPAFRKAAPEKVPGSRSGMVVSRLQNDRLIATRIRGKYWMYYTHPCALASSDDLIDWTPAGKSVWPGGHEAGAVALLRDEGILLMFNSTIWPSRGIWTLGQALVDRDDLLTVLKRQDQPFLYPELDWETKGFTDSTTVANTLVPFKGQWLLYYGAADRHIGVAVLTPEASSPWSLTEAVEPPPNAPATVEWSASAGQLRLLYRGAVMLDATVRAEDARGREAAGIGVKLERSETLGEKVEQRLKLLPAAAQEGVRLVVSAIVTGSEETFPAETRGEAQKQFPYVRNSVGLSRNLRNNALYDRRWDWVLIGPGDGATHIQPKQVEDGRITFTWESRGAVVELVFRPRFYQKHRDLANFEPWTYNQWKGSLTGYCTWWAYKYDFTQKTLDELTAVFAEKHLPDFGYRYIQLDDTYQIGNGSCPQNWLTWNDKFPGGPAYTIDKIRSIGMKPGIWVHRVHRPSDPHVADIGKEHPDWFVEKPDGSLYVDGGFYLLNTANKEALDQMARRTYRELKKQGWDYVKIDGAGDLLYSYKNQQCVEHFRKIGSTPERSLREWDLAAREELGPETYILSCWGVYPGLSSIGLVDGCRLGSDGFGPAGLQQYNSFGGVVWRNDPDHCDILAEWLKPKTYMKVFATGEAMADSVDQPCVASMAGAVLLVSDKVEAYRDDRNLEGMKRSAPVLFTVPGQLYDYSERGTGNYHASLRGGEAPWWVLEIDLPFDHWSVLARFNWRRQDLEWKRPGAPAVEVKFADLGLHDDREYLVFEFWSQKFLGKSRGSFTAPAQDVGDALQVFALREARAHPWVLSTTRHISQGGVSLLDERWDAGKKALSGKSVVVAGDPYVLTVHLPDGFRLAGAEIIGENAEIANREETASVRIVPSATKAVEWEMTFAR